MTIIEKIYHHMNQHNILYNDEITQWITSISDNFDTHILIRPDSITFRGIGYSIDGSTNSGRNIDTERQQWNPSGIVEILISEIMQEELDFRLRDEIDNMIIFESPPCKLMDDKTKQILRNNKKKDTFGWKVPLV